MSNSRRSAKENPFEWNVSSSENSSSAKAEILEIQRQQEIKEPTKDEFKFSEPRVSDSLVSKIAFCVSLDDDVNLHDENHCVMKKKQKFMTQSIKILFFSHILPNNFLM